jgi:hypothetical protein
MLIAKRNDPAGIGWRLLGPAPEYVEHPASVADGIDLRMWMRHLAGVRYCLRSDFRRLINISQVPQRPGEVAEHSRADVLPILIAVLGRFFWVIKCARPLEVLATSDELAHGDKGRAKRAMRQAESSAVAMTLGLFDKF